MWYRVEGMLLDLLGCAFSYIAVVGLAALVPRVACTWTRVGAHTLSVYLLHLYVLPAVDVPLAALTQVASYFLHPEAAAPTALIGCLLVVRALALPLPTTLLPPAVSAAATWATKRAVSDVSGVIWHHGWHHGWHRVAPGRAPSGYHKLSRAPSEFEEPLVESAA